MKKFIVSAGLASVSAVGLQAAYAPGLTPMETSKPWAVSADLRGFYDDNYLSAPSGSKKSSGGFEISPSVRLNFPLEQTYIGASYLYSLKYYFDRKNNSADHTHEFTLKLDHRLSERYKVSFDDSFVYSAEPSIVDSTGPVTAPIQRRQNSDAIRNRATFKIDGQITETLGFGASYQNTWYDYVKNSLLQAELNRVEHLFDVHGTWQVQEHLTGLFGYQFGINDYTSDKLLNPTLGPITAANPNGSETGNSRDNKSHYFYVGAEHAFSSQLNGSVRVGAEYTSYDHLSQTAWNPYVDLRGTYTYLPGSYVQFGITHSRNATDVIGTGTATGLTTDAESTTLFASINHRITPRVTGSLMGQYQRSSFSGGTEDGKVDNYYLASVTLDYKINNNWLFDVGYNLDHLQSDEANRGFTRNVVYAGVRATF